MQFIRQLITRTIELSDRISKINHSNLVGLVSFYNQSTAPQFVGNTSNFFREFQFQDVVWRNINWHDDAYI